MAKLAKIVLRFDDGTEHAVPEGYTAVYVNAERAKRAQEKEPWEKEPPRISPVLRVRDMGKDEPPPVDREPRCYSINDAITCPYGRPPPAVSPDRTAVRASAAREQLTRQRV